ncbi:hypothetical protein EJB05_40318 [Eragrostis curvula]|uniref:NAC domain-containing protein n=1 Tax=Eragrostis curvula TaxID=38414 RepID=A0A5J9TZI9_9POAL|nr:hypothetical protein EJB05_40318 [Eragrostis curvula]
MAKTSLPPGFRFHPTDVELTVYYLKRKVLGKHIRCNAIAEIDLYKFAPWELPEKASLESNDLVWYFFCPRDKKYSIGVRTNRTTGAGYWKATGKDRAVIYNSRTVGMKRTLVFHLGKPPRGCRTDWVMYEYRLEDKELAASGVKLDACVLCKIFQKSGPGPKIGAQYGAPFNEAEWNDARSNSELAANGVQVRPDRTSPDIPFDIIHLELLAEIIGCSSLNCLFTAGEDGSQPGSGSDSDNDDIILLDDNETIFSELDKLASQSVESNSHHCDWCGQHLIQPKLEAVGGEQYLELNDLSFSLADDPNSCSMLLSSDIYVQHPLDHVARIEQDSQDYISNIANASASIEYTHPLWFT